MNLRIESKAAGSPLLSDKKLAAIAGDLYAELRKNGLRPREVIAMTSHLLANVLKGINADKKPANPSETGREA